MKYSVYIVGFYCQGRLNIEGSIPDSFCEKNCTEANEGTFGSTFVRLEVIFGCWHDLSKLWKCVKFAVRYSSLMNQLHGVPLFADWKVRCNL